MLALPSALALAISLLPPPSVALTQTGSSGVDAEDALVNVRPFSIVGPHTGTLDGSYAFIAEGASIAEVEDNF